MACTMGSYFHVGMGLTPRTRIGSSSSGNNKISTSNSNLRWSAARQGRCCLLRATGSVAEDVTTRKLSLSSSLSTLPFRTSPWVAFPPINPKENMFYSYEEEKIIEIQKPPKMEDVGWPQCMSLGSSHGWLFYINRGDCSLYLLNPISHRIINLPSIDTLPSVKPDPPYLMIEKLIISSSPDDNDEDCIAMCIYGINERLAFFRPGHDTSWIPLDEGGFSTMEIAYSCKDQLFYSFNALEMLECWDLRDPSSPKLELVKKLVEEEEEEHHFTPFPGVESRNDLWSQYHCDLIPYLIADPWSDDVLMVHRSVVYDIPEGGNCFMYNDYPYETRFFEVYKVDLRSGKMKYQHSLNDRVLFVGNNQPFSLSSSDFPYLRRNFIYVNGLEMDPKNIERCYFNYEDKVFEPSRNRHDVKKEKFMPVMQPPIVWFTPNPDPRLLSISLMSRPPVLEMVFYFGLN